MSRSCSRLPRDRASPAGPWHDTLPGQRHAQVGSAGVVPATDGTSTAAKFAGERQHRVIPHVGHNLPQENPTAFAAAVWELALKKR